MKKIVNLIKNIDEKELYSYYALFIVLVVTCSLLIIYSGHSRVKKYNFELIELNKKIKEAQDISNKYSKVQQQQKLVSQQITNDPEFRIASTYKDLLKKLGLIMYQSTDPVNGQGDSVQNMIERTLSAQLNSITMKNCVDLLESIEKINQIYTKELTLSKSSKWGNLDLAILIATLEPATRN